MSSKCLLFICVFIYTCANQSLEVVISHSMVAWFLLNKLKSVSFIFEDTVHKPQMLLRAVSKLTFSQRRGELRIYEDHFGNFLTPITFF